MSYLFFAHYFVHTLVFSYDISYLFILMHFIADYVVRVVFIVEIRTVTNSYFSVSCLYVVESSLIGTQFVRSLFCI